MSPGPTSRRSTSRGDSPRLLSDLGDGRLGWAFGNASWTWATVIPKRAPSHKSNPGTARTSLSRVTWAGGPGAAMVRKCSPTFQGSPASTPITSAICASIPSPNLHRGYDQLPPATSAPSERRSWVGFGRSESAANVAFLEGRWSLLLGRHRSERSARKPDGRAGQSDAAYQLRPVPVSLQKPTAHHLSIVCRAEPWLSPDNVRGAVAAEYPLMDVRRWLLQVHRLCRAGGVGELPALPRATLATPCRSDFRAFGLGRPSRTIGLCGAAVDVVAMPHDIGHL